MRITVGVLSFALCAVACSTDSNDDAPDGKDAGTEQFDPEVCRDQPRADGLEMIPWSALAVSFSRKACVRGDASVLLVNSSDRTIQVERIGASDLVWEDASPRDTSAAFDIVVDGLPRDLEPSEVLPVRVAFDAQLPDITAHTHLVVVTDAGCQTVGNLHGTRDPEEAPFGTTPYVVNFGVLRPNEVSDIVEVEFVRGVGEGATSFFLGVTDTSAPEMFEVVTPFQGDLSGDCDKVNVGVRWTAPSALGAVNAQLFFVSSTRTAKGEVSGFGEVALRGLVAN